MVGHSDARTKSIVMNQQLITVIAKTQVYGEIFLNTNSILHVRRLSGAGAPVKKLKWLVYGVPQNGRLRSDINCICRRQYKSFTDRQAVRFNPSLERVPLPVFAEAGPQGLGPLPAILLNEKRRTRDVGVEQARG